MMTQRRTLLVTDSIRSSGRHLGLLRLTLDKTGRHGGVVYDDLLDKTGKCRYYEVGSGTNSKKICFATGRYDVVYAASWFYSKQGMTRYRE